jgi:hypothetical protein
MLVVSIERSRTMPGLEQTVQRYIDSWNETDARRRRALIEEVYTPDAGYTDPLVAVSGWDAIDQTVQAVQRQFPGLRFTLGDLVDTHHDQVRFGWKLGAGASEPLVVGFDVAVAHDGEGKFEQVYGFLDRVPSA